MTKSLSLLNVAKSKRLRRTSPWTVLFVLSLGWTMWSTTILANLQRAKTTTSTNDNNYPQQQHRRNDCDPPKYKGILLIQQGDREGAAGTIFYLFVLNQLLYAELHGLFPWIHLSNTSQWVYDEQVHGNGNGNDNNNITKDISRLIVTAPDFDPTLPAGLVDECPAAPPLHDSSQYRIQRITLPGNGVWSSYFQPQDVPTCYRTLPVVTLTPDQILHGLHLRCPWSIRAWRYGGTPLAVQKRELSLHDWWEPQRYKAAELVARYYHWQPDITAAIDAVSPPQPCLGLHIRHSDKANKRKRLNVTDFVPFLEAYWKWIPNGHIYLATDSDAVVEELQKVVSTHNPRSVVHVQPHVWRSSNTSAVFQLTEHHDATNRQVLIDIGALSRCTFLLHGLSAVSEAAIYHNPALHERSYNLETHGGPPHVEDWEHILESSAIR